MKNVLEIFEALDPKLDIKKNLEFTYEILSTVHSRKSLMINSLLDLMKLMQDLESSGEFTLSNGNQTYNFLTLMEIMKQSNIHQLQVSASLIRTELMIMTTLDNFEKMKPILLFWDGFHCVLSFIEFN